MTAYLQEEFEKKILQRFDAQLFQQLSAITRKKKRLSQSNLPNPTEYQLWKYHVHIFFNLLNRDSYKPVILSLHSFPYKSSKARIMEAGSSMFAGVLPQLFS